MSEKNVDSPIFWLGPFARCNEAYDRDMGLVLSLIWVIFPWVWNIFALWGVIVLVSFLI